MFKFIKESLAEFDHVVWPTPNETKKYMYYTIGTILVVGAMLAIADTLLRTGLQGVRDQFPHDTPTVTVSGEENATQDELDAITEKLETAKKANSGTTSSGKVIVPTTGTGVPAI
jgi:preprotein translocase SecE subunit